MGNLKKRMVGDYVLSTHHILLLESNLISCLIGEVVPKDDAELMQEWFSLVHEKTQLSRYEQELLVRAKELELEDRHARLQQDLRGRMADDGKLTTKPRRCSNVTNSNNSFHCGACLCHFHCSLYDFTRSQLDNPAVLLPRFSFSKDDSKDTQAITQERDILNEILSIVEQRDALVAMLENDRLRYGGFLQRTAYRRQSLSYVNDIMLPSDELDVELEAVAPGTLRLSVTHFVCGLFLVILGATLAWLMLPDDS